MRVADGEKRRKGKSCHPLQFQSSSSSSKCFFEFTCKKKSDFHTVLTCLFWIVNRKRVLFGSGSVISGSSFTIWKEVIVQKTIKGIHSAWSFGFQPRHFW